MKVPYLDLKAQYERIRQEVNARILSVLNHGQFILGPEVTELEERLADFAGTRYCIGCASGTDALLMSLMSLGIGVGDEVITTPFTFVATAETISLLGAVPVFVDIDPRTYNINPQLIEPAITPATRAIVPVSLFGQCSDMDTICAIGDNHGIAVIEDAAQSFGATYKDRRSTNLCLIGCTSFFPAKPLGCYGDGGACFTNDDDIATALRQIRAHGQESRYHHARVGINGRIDTLQAAVLLAKLNIFDDEIRRRQEIAIAYDSMLSDSVTTPYVEPYNRSVYAQYTIACESRNEVAKKLKEVGIPTAVHYPVPLHLQRAFLHLGYRPGDFPTAEHAAESVLSLPLHPYLTWEQTELIAQELKTSLTLGASV